MSWDLAIKESTLKVLSVVITFLMTLTGCNVTNSDQQPSRELAALQAKVKIDLPILSASWEIFGTPEYKGGVPGPTDLQTLVAEFILMDPDFKAHAKLERAAEVFVAPEASRFWMSPGFRKMMNEVRNSTEDMGQAYGCFEYEASLSHAGRPVNGFLCVSGDRALLYLTLDRR